MTHLSLDQCSPLAGALLAGILLILGVWRLGPPAGLGRLPGWLKEWFLWWTSPFVWLLSRWRSAPTALNVAGLLFSLAAGVLYAFGHAPWAGWTFLLAGLCDTLDGRVARAQDGAHRQGAFVDSVLDRYSEIAIFTGLGWWLRQGPGLWLCWVALFSSLMVSYSRARAEGLGLQLKEGLMQRPQRIVLLTVASIFCPIGLLVGSRPETLILVALGIAACLTAFTALQRFWVALRGLREGSSSS